MKKLVLLPSLIALVLSLPQQVCGEAMDTLKLTHRVGLDFRPAYLVQDEPLFKGENEAGKPMRYGLSAHLKYSFQFNEQSRFGRLYPHAYQGIGFSYNSFGNQQELGSPVALYLFQGSRIASLSSTLSLDYEWNFGASFGWKRYDREQNPHNGVVGSKINAFLGLGFLLNWQLAPQWRLTAGVDLSHFSNGNTRYPNQGVDLFGGRVGVVHLFGADSRGNRTTTFFPAEPFQSTFSYDLILYGATRKRAVLNVTDPYMIPGSFGIAGMNFTPMYSFSRYFRAGLSLDAQYDESANVVYHYAGGGPENPKFYRPSFREQFAVGLSARAEWVMPIFAVNVGIGYNVLQKGEDTKGWYQVVALKSFVTRHLFLHVGYQLSKFKDPNNLMLGLGWRFQ